MTDTRRRHGGAVLPAGVIANLNCETPDKRSHNGGRSLPRLSQKSTSGITEVNMHLDTGIENEPAQAYSQAQRPDNNPLAVRDANRAYHPPRQRRPAPTPSPPRPIRPGHSNPRRDPHEYSAGAGSRQAVVYPSGASIIAPEAVENAARSGNGQPASLSGRGHNTLYGSMDSNIRTPNLGPTSSTTSLTSHPAPSSTGRAVRVAPLQNTSVSNSLERVVSHVSNDARRKLHQVNYKNMFDDDTNFRFKHPRFHQTAFDAPQDVTATRYRDAVGRVSTGVDGEGFIDPNDCHLARVMIQSTDAVYKSRSKASWRRTFLRNAAPWAIRIANWPVNSTTANKKQWDSQDWKWVLLKWPVASIALSFVLCKPWRLYPGAKHVDKYLDFPYKYWGYAKVARNALEEESPSRHSSEKPLPSEYPLPNDKMHQLTKRYLFPRRLCFLGADDSAPAELSEVDKWIQKHNFVEHDMRYVVVSYIFEQFSAENSEDIADLHAIAAAAARAAGVPAYWLSMSCMSSDKRELEDDVFRISDVVRGAQSVVIAVRPRGNDERGLDAALKEWGNSMWTLPEALLSTREQPIRVYTCEQQLPRLIKVAAKRELISLVWKDSALARQLVEHYDGNLGLSRLELVILALRCLCYRSRCSEKEKYLEGDLAYVLMGLLRQRPVVDGSDSEFQAFARLSLANDSDSLLERLICISPKRQGQDWHCTDDVFNVSLWDIQPTCQIAGVGHDDTVILDGCYGATISWDTLPTVNPNSKSSVRRKCAKVLLRIGALMWLIGWIFVIIAASVASPGSSGFKLRSRSPEPQYDSYFSSYSGGGSAAGNVYAYIAVALILLQLPIGLASPWLVRRCYSGKSWNVAPHLLGFEGYLDLQTVESQIYGTFFGRLSWSVAGSELSHHRKNEFGECIGEDPTNDPAVAEVCQRANQSGPETMKIFTLVDTRQGLVTLFQAERPPVAMIICGQEGGMQRGVMVSLDWKQQTLYREAVLRVPTVMLDNMWRVNRVRVGLTRAGR